LIKTHSARQLITDSAAGATAFACGKKTYNGAIAVDTSGKPMPTLFEEASEKGMSTGLAVTSTITHATPACFYAHQPKRSMYYEIADDLASALRAGRVDLAIGYGLEEFNQRPDERDLVAEMEAENVQILGEEAFGDPRSWKIESVAGAVLLSGEPPRTGGRPDDYLANAAGFALERLGGQDKPFILVVEGSQIDWGGHANERDYILAEMRDFEFTLETILDYAVRDGETLVVVTADHETGGFAINGGNLTGDSLATAFTTEHHTGTMVPLFAIGPGADQFAGMYDNTEVYTKLRAALGWN
jgi:alkaline phosphatase